MQKSKTLKHIYPLIDTKEPQLFRELFPYDEVPKITFDGVIHPISIPEDIFITCTTFRDGQQARPPYTVKQIVDIYKMLHKLGGPRGIIRQCEFFLYSNKDKEAVRKCLELNYKYPEITGWIRAVKDDLKLVKEMGLKETGILTSISDYHIFLKLKKNRRQAIEAYLALVEECLACGIRARCHLEDITRADIYGVVLPFVQHLMELGSKSSLEIPVKIRLCDTMGFGVPFPEAELPRGVPKLIWTLINEGGVPSEALEWHGHNDFHMVLVNAVTAWLYGCCAANGTLLGFGERTGNPPIEALIIEYMSFTGRTDGINARVITEIAEYYRKEINANIPPNYPFVGTEFNVTRAGIHADGVIKNEEIYNIFNTKKILNRPLGISITDKSGTAGIAYWINQHLGLKGKRAIDKRHPGVLSIYHWVMDQYEQGRTTSISPEELEMQARKFLPELFISDYEILKQRAFEMAEHILQETSMDSALLSMDVKRMERKLRQVLKANPFIQRLYVTNLEGIQITNNIVMSDIRPIYKGHGKGELKIDCPWVAEPLKNGKMFVSDFYKSIYTDLLCISVSAPIKKDGQILGVLVADIKFEDIVKTEHT